MDDQQPTYDTDKEGNEEDTRKNPAKEQAKEILKDSAKKGGKKAFRKAREEATKKFGKKAAEQAVKQGARTGAQSASGVGGSSAGVAAGTEAAAAGATSAATAGTAAGTTAAGTAAGAAGGTGATAAVVGAIDGIIGVIAAGGWIVILIIIVVVIIVVIIVLLLGGSQQASCAGGLTTTGNVISIATPPTFTLTDCPQDAVFVWQEDSATPLGGTFASQGQSTTLYTPPAVATSTPLIIRATVCLSTSPKCSDYSMTLTVVPAACTAISSASCYSTIDGSVKSKCTDQGGKIISLATGCATDTTCCQLSPGGDYTTPDCANVDQRLRGDFGVVLNPAGDKELTCASKQKIYKVYAVAFQSPTYKRYLNPAVPFKFTLFPAESKACGSSAEAKSAYEIQFSGLSEYLECGSLTGAGLFIIHETGHIINSRHYTLFTQQFPYNDLRNSDNSCFFPASFCKYAITKTYTLCWNNAIHESFAEFSALYAYNKKYGAPYNIMNFKSECPNSWDYMNKSLYGGTIIRP
jgi:hypothetical protein